jgi:hypothetical protein
MMLPCQVVRIDGCAFFTNCDQLLESFRALLAPACSVESGVIHFITARQTHLPLRISGIARRNLAGNPHIRQVRFDRFIGSAKYGQYPTESLVLRCQVSLSAHVRGLRDNGFFHEFER